MSERKCWVVMIDHRNWGNIIHGVYLSKDSAFVGLKEMADEFEQDTIRRFGGCDREPYKNTCISLGDTGTVQMIEAPFKIGGRLV